MTHLFPEAIRKYLTANQYHRERWCAIFGVLAVAAEMWMNGNLWGIWAAFPVLVLKGLQMNGGHRASPLLRFSGMSGCILFGIIAALSIFPETATGAVFCIAYSTRCLRVSITTYRDAKDCLNVARI